MPIMRRPRRPLNKNPMLRSSAPKMQAKQPLHHRMQKAGEKLVRTTAQGIRTGQKIFRAGKELRARARQAQAFRETFGKSRPKFSVTLLEEEELEQFFSEFDEQFGSHEELMQAIEQGNILPEMFEAIERKMSKEERLQLIKLLRKRLRALKNGDHVEAGKLAFEAQKIVSNARIRAGV